MKKTAKHKTEVKQKPEVKRYNLVNHVVHELKHNEGTMLKQFGLGVAQELLKTKITTKFKTRKHKFSNGVGEVAKKLIIEVDFQDAVVQPHTHFEDDFCHPVAVALEENINGLMENSGG